MALSCHGYSFFNLDYFEAKLKDRKDPLAVKLLTYLGAAEQVLGSHYRPR
jgi:hypothetical protein